VVVGLGASGLAAARVLAEEGASVRVSERRDAVQVEGVAELEELGVEVLAGGHDESHLDGATLVVTSPGVPGHAPILEAALSRGLEVWSELELGARLCEAPMVAVTGTNGKTTTTALLAAAMREAGLDAVACGNIGYPLSLAAREDHDALAVEASSFQLRFTHELRPRVSVLLNVAPDHLDWHGSFQAYAAAKARVFERQRPPADVHVGNRDDATASALSAGAPCPLVWFRLGEPQPGEVGYLEGRLVSRPGSEHVDLGVPAAPGAGFRADAAAAAGAGLAFGLDPAPLARALQTTPPLPHRGGTVATVEGVRFVDDSKATNPHAALAALDGLTGVVLVAGGLSKGVDLSPLAAALPALAGVVVLGEAGAEIAALFEGHVPVRKAGSIEEAAGLGLELAPVRGTVLLAPACASQDMFRDYAERGERFAAAARALAGAGGEGVARG
jgi:UDP-N-acetylmuramoylalanine--D-glutamate ligase